MLSKLVNLTLWKVVGVAVLTGVWGFLLTTLPTLLAFPVWIVGLLILGVIIFAQ